MKFDASSLIVVLISVVASWTGLSIKYDQKLDALSNQIDACAYPKGEASLARNSEDANSALLSQIAEATKISTRSLETSERIERRLDAETGAGLSNEESPFTKDGDWWVAAGDAMFLIPGGIVVGNRNEGCTYGRGVLSVDNGSWSGDHNCPSGSGSVTFGSGNKAIGPSTSVTGGYGNIAEEQGSSVSGGNRNKTVGQQSSISGGDGNTAIGVFSTITGGMNNKANKICSSITGGIRNRADGKFSTILGGKNKITRKMLGTSYKGLKSI